MGDVESNNESGVFRSFIEGDPAVGYSSDFDEIRNYRTGFTT